MAPMLRPSQFTLKSVFVATTFIAFACVAARYIVSPFGEPMGRLLAWIAIPIFLGGAFGVIRGRVWPWLAVGAAIAAVFIGSSFLSTFFLVH